MSTLTWQRTWFIAYKEMLHILRDPQTLFFTLVVPIAELCMLGYAIEMNVRYIPTVIVDFAGTQESNSFLRRFENSKDFRVVQRCFSEEEARQLIVAGKAHVGIVIPRDYSQKLQAGQTAAVSILVDGSVSSIAAEAVNVGNALALQESLERALGSQQLPVEARPRLLFNPDTRTANFLLPGLIVILCQMMATIMSATAIVREKEFGTLEQLYMTPIRRSELILGKMAPYVILTVLEFCLVALLMRTIFQVPIHGYFVSLVALLLPFTLTMLGVGLLISTKAASRDAAMQMAMGTILPSIFLSGYVFTLDSMPAACKVISYFIPTTWLIDASRGIILRGADWSVLWLHAAVLWTMAVGMLSVSAFKLRKRLT